MDDVLIFCYGTVQDVEKLSEILELFGKAKGMVVSSQKSTFTVINMEEEEVQRYSSIFPFGLKLIDDVLNI